MSVWNRFIWLTAFETIVTFHETQYEGHDIGCHNSVMFIYPLIDSINATNLLIFFSFRTKYLYVRF
jgi:hypothetical protein